MDSINITPSWSDIGLMYTRYAECGEQKCCRTLTPEVKKAFAAATAYQALLSSFSQEQIAQAAVILAAEFVKLGITTEAGK